MKRQRYGISDHSCSYHVRQELHSRMARGMVDIMFKPTRTQSWDLLICQTDPLCKCKQHSLSLVCFFFGEWGFNEQVFRGPQTKHSVLICSIHTK